jgi:hypothetical protein
LRSNTSLYILDCDKYNAEQIKNEKMKKKLLFLPLLFSI